MMRCQLYDSPKPPVSQDTGQDYQKYSRKVIDNNRRLSCECTERTGQFLADTQLQEPVLYLPMFTALQSSSVLPLHKRAYIFLKEGQPDKQTVRREEQAVHVVSLQSLLPHPASLRMHFLAMFSFSDKNIK